MSLTAPPRPERELRPGDQVDAEAGEALVEALIKEARRRARRRRRRNGAVALLVVAAGVAVFLGFGGRGGGGAGSAASARLPREEGPGTSARSAPPLGAFPAKMGWTTAFVFDPRNPDTVYASAGTTSSLTRSTRADMSSRRPMAAHTGARRQRQEQVGRARTRWPPIRTVRERSMQATSSPSTRRSTAAATGGPSTRGSSRQNPGSAIASGLRDDRNVGSFRSARLERRAGIAARDG